MNLSSFFALLRLLGLAVLLAGALPSHAQSACQSRVFNSHEERVSAAYIAYYGRPADTGGLAYWAGKLAEEGGRLDAIIDAFGNSAEYRQRFGSLGTRELIRNLYQQLYGRDPDAAGWAYYQTQLSSGQQSLASIAIAIMNGTVGSDVAVFGNRETVARHFVTRMESLGAAAPQITDGDLLAGLISATLADSASMSAACERADELMEGGGLIAGRYRLIEDGNIVRDLVNGLEWQRCVVGTAWNGNVQSCGSAAQGGVAVYYHQLKDVIQLTAPGGFRVPSIDELKTLVYCPSGQPQQFGPLPGQGGCRGDFVSPTIVREAFPGEFFYFWSKDGYPDMDVGWIMGFDTGRAILSGAYNVPVRLVRAR